MVAWDDPDVAFPWPGRTPVPWGRDQRGQSPAAYRERPAYVYPPGRVAGNGASP